MVSKDGFAGLDTYSNALDPNSNGYINQDEAPEESYPMVRDCAGGIDFSTLGPPPSLNADDDGLVSKDELDQHGDGHIDLDEASTGLRGGPLPSTGDQTGNIDDHGMRSQRELSRLDTRFDTLNRRGDGYIDPDEAPTKDLGEARLPCLEIKPAEEHLPQHLGLPYSHLKRYVRRNYSRIRARKNFSCHALIWFIGYLLLMTILFLSPAIGIFW